jgi:thiol-disulfide isomerase/thioredoxin
MRRLATALLFATACQSPPSPGVVKDAPSAVRPSMAATTAATAPSATTAGTAASATDGASAAAKSPAKVVVVEAAEDMDALSQIRTERLKAKTEGRVLVVYVGAKWCEPCRKFKQEIHSGALDARLSSVTLLAFDADKDQDRLATVGYTFRFIPYVALPGADGQAVDSQEARGKGAAAWRELLGKLEAWQARPQ